MTKNTVMPHHQVVLLHQTHLAPSKVETWDVKLVLVQEGAKGKEEDEVGALLSPGLSMMALITQSCLYLSRTQHEFRVVSLHFFHCL